MAFQCGTQRRELLKLWQNSDSYAHKPGDCEIEIRYCRWFRDSPFNDILNPELTLDLNEPRTSIKEIVLQTAYCLPDTISTLSTHFKHQHIQHDFEFWTETQSVLCVKEEIPQPLQTAVKKYRNKRCIKRQFFTLGLNFKH